MWASGLYSSLEGVTLDSEAEGEEWFIGTKGSFWFDFRLDRTVNRVCTNRNVNLVSKVSAVDG
ncbi:hypothetical protein Mapa_006142 [Marchantia paleacea]|nr:hypothetical protein Mapa_006142 [Marchantia paleacea]